MPKKILFYTINFFNYDKIVPPPKLEGKVNFKYEYLYVTDDKNKVDYIKGLGWDYVFFQETDSDASNYDKRQNYVRPYCDGPQRLGDIFINNFDICFKIDAHVSSFCKEFGMFVEDCLDNLDKAYFIMGDFYGIGKKRNSMMEELKESLIVVRWKQYYEEIKHHYYSHRKDLAEKNIKFDECGVSYAKYIGYNVKSEHFEKMFNIVSSINSMQGNIKYTYISYMYPEMTHTSSKFSYEIWRKNGRLPHIGRR